MNKAELVASVAGKAELSQKEAASAVNAVIDSISEALSAKEDVTLVGFGSFTVSERAERKGRNPQTGEEITIPAKLVPSFKAGKGLKEMING
jgi:DNA-binding protein HU-beta